MKRIVLLLLTTGYSFCSAQDWVQVAVFQLKSFTKVKWTSDSTAYIVGDLGILFKTTDSGNTWDSLDNPLNIYNASYFTCGFKNSDTGFVTRNSKSFFKTFNGGSTWDSMSCQPFNCSDNGFFDMDVRVDQVNLIMANKLYHSDDLGNNWEEALNMPPGFSKLSFPSSMTGYAVGGYPGFEGLIYKSTDNGNHWSELNWNYPEAIISVDFWNDQNGCIGTTGNIYKTLDGGNTWGLVYSGISVITSIKWYSSEIAYAATGDDKILKSVDGGTSWAVDYSGSATISAIDCTSKNCLAVTNTGTILRVESPTGIHDPSFPQQEVSIYPNPCTDHFFIHHDVALKAVSIYNAVDMVMKNYLKNGDEILLENLAPGFYWLKITTEKSFYTIKLIKEK